MPERSDTVLSHMANHLQFLASAQSFWFTLDTSYDHGCHLARRLRLNPEEYEAGRQGGSNGGGRARAAGAAWQRRQKHGDSVGSAVAALAERWRQHGSSAATVGSAAAALAARGQRRQRDEIDQDLCRVEIDLDLSWKHIGL
jgi:hypothetical protein